jgi:energy-coupling factor transporter ATP-binding protein EcfA2
MSVSLRQPPVFGSHPSRDSNPFATCWTRPGAVAFHFATDQTAESLIAQLAAANWWGEIVGPHGSGKSTLLAALQPALQAAGRNLYCIALRDGQRHLPREFWPCQPQSNAAVVIIDGYEQLGYLARWQLKCFCRRAKSGLLVTSHAPTGLPTLIHMSPDGGLVQQLVEQLCQHSLNEISPQDIAASHARHGSNVREIFFDLYDRHERLRRGERTFSPAAT